MGVVVNFQIKAVRENVRRQIREHKENLERAVLQRLIKIGEQFVINARSTVTYKDRTKNLRSSIGYVILKDGVQLVEDFGTSSEVATKKAVEVAWEVAADYPTGFLLIGVAGMNYAAAVESKGYDVITGAAGIAEASLIKAMDNIKNELTIIANEL